MSASVTVIAFGTFDLFHYGHLRILQRAAELGDRLVVGVSSDALNKAKKDVSPVYPQDHRKQIVEAIRWVNEAFIEESLELKAAYIKQYNADLHQCYQAHSQPKESFQY